MAQRMSFFVPLGDVVATVGAWARAVAAGIASLDKTAADNTSVLYIPLDAGPETPHPHERNIESVELQYSVATAALDAAPTVTFAKVTKNAATGVRSRAAITTTKAVVGTDTVGLAVGTYTLTATPETPIRCEPNEEAVLEVTVDAAATSVVKLGSVKVNLA